MPPSVRPVGALQRVFWLPGSAIGAAAAYLLREWVSGEIARDRPRKSHARKPVTNPARRAFKMERREMDKAWQYQAAASDMDRAAQICRRSADEARSASQQIDHSIDVMRGLIDRMETAICDLRELTEKIESGPPNNTDSNRKETNG